MAEQKKRVKRVPVEVSTTVGGAVDTAFGVIEELASELRDWYDNMPENLQGGSKGDEVDEAASDLENISEPDVPDFLQDLPVVFQQLPLKARASRSDRLDDGLQYARNALSELEAKLEASDALPEGDPAKLSTGQRDELDSFLSELNDLIDNSEAVSFPGMY